MKDVGAFCELARDKGLFVWLHIGPYVGAEWDMGGLPWWLLNVKGISLRSTQQAFMMRVERYFAALGQELSSLMIGNGGNIALLQIEEEQGLTKDDKEYLKVVLDCAKRTGFDNIVTFTATTKENFVVNTIPEVLAEEVKCFGDGILTDGFVDRKKLAKKVKKCLQIE